MWADFEELRTSAACPVCARKIEFLLKRPPDGEEYFRKVDCQCKGAFLTAGWVFGDYHWDFSVNKVGMDVLEARFRRH